MKKGGYTWAGAWVDPTLTAPVRGVVEHPTMSNEESYAKWTKAIVANQKYKKAKRAVFDAQGSGFSDMSL